MSDVEANSPTPAAAAPLHPDHARWLKERTLKMEIDHVKGVGGTLRDAEAANDISLARLEQNKRAAKPAAPDVNPGRAARQAERASTAKMGGVKARPFFNAVAPVEEMPASPCKMCGQCRRCKREIRIVAIAAKARAGELAAQALAWDLTGGLLNFQARADYKAGMGRVFEFSKIFDAQEAGRAFVAFVEDVCDRSVKLCGAWR